MNLNNSKYFEKKWKKLFGFFEYFEISPFKFMIQERRGLL